MKRTKKGPQKKLRRLPVAICLSKMFIFNSAEGCWPFSRLLPQPVESRFTLYSDPSWPSWPRGRNQVLIAPGHQQQQLESNGIAALDSLKIPKMPQQTIKVGRVEPLRKWLNVNFRDAACALAQQWLRRTAGQPKPRPSKQAAAGAGKGGSSLSCLTFSKYLSRLHNTHLKNTL